MMEAVRTSETSVDNHFTRQYNPEDSSEHHIRRRENLKSHTGNKTFYLTPTPYNQVEIALLQGRKNLRFSYYCLQVNLKSKKSTPGNLVAEAASYVTLVFNIRVSDSVQQITPHAWA
jgi:hypothetical protein